MTDKDERIDFIRIPPRLDCRALGQRPPEPLFRVARDNAGMTFGDMWKEFEDGQRTK
jgi:hypothetical protein